LTGLQAHFRSGSRPKPNALTLAAVVCVALLALLTVVQVAHIHPVNSDADRCPLCIVMHSAAPVAVMAALVVMVSFGPSTPLIEARIVVRHRHPKLFTRPPPTGC
jgi:protein-S-isoprenylcysteine O-methyltransferase Ste14